MSGHQPGYESGATPASGFVPPSTGTRTAPPPLPWPQRPVHRREPDRVRHAALSLAVELVANAYDLAVELVANAYDLALTDHTSMELAGISVKVAQVFERYLAGEGGQP